VTTTPDLSGIGDRLVRSIIKDATALGTDLADPAARPHFIHGIEAAYGWLTALHEAGRIDDAGFKLIEETLAAQIAAARRAGD
jgi:hypothetical protein